MTDHFLCYLTAVCLAVALAVAGAEVLDHLQARDAAHADCRAELDAERAVGWAPEEARKQLDLVEAALSRTDLGRGWVGPEDVAQAIGALQMVQSDGEFDSLHEVTRKFVVDVLALLKKGGG